MSKALRQKMAEVSPAICWLKHVETAWTQWIQWILPSALPTPSDMAAEGKRKSPAYTKRYGLGKFGPPVARSTVPASPVSPRTQEVGDSPGGKTLRSDGHS